MILMDPFVKPMSRKEDLYASSSKYWIFKAPVIMNNTQPTNEKKRSYNIQIKNIHY